MIVAMRKPIYSIYIIKKRQLTLQCKIFIKGSLLPLHIYKRLSEPPYLLIHTAFNFVLDITVPFEQIRLTINTFQHRIVRSTFNPRLHY